MADSVGLALYRQREGQIAEVQMVEVLIGHMGGPFFARKDAGGWTFPKGLADPGETPIQTAEREFEEEMGHAAPPGPSHDLGVVKASGKTIRILAREGTFDSSIAVSNTFELEWPRGSGRIQTFPELDRAAWVALDHAAALLTKGQAPFIERLRAMMEAQPDEEGS